MSRNKDDADDRTDAHHAGVTSEVGNEGGSPGDVETGVAPTTAHGSEATESYQPDDRDRVTIVHDDTGRGRRNP